MSAGPPPVSAAARGLRLGCAALEAGAAEVLGRFARGQARPAPGAGASRVMLQALLELRGAALKVAQFLSLEDDLLPDGAAQQLARACHAVPPMGPDYARLVLRRQIGPIEQHFASFDATPFAAASLGQVHAATTHAGQAVAVKIQYPGMPDTVRSDLRLLRRAVGLLPHAAHYRRLLGEMEARLLEECDYHQEAAALAWFGQKLVLPGVTVAQVLPDLCAGAVLTTARLPGLHLDAWLATQPSQAVRDRAAQALYDSFVQSLHQLGRLHADPNPGNLLFDDGGHIGLLDFGCTRWITPDYQAIVTRIWRAAVAGDDTAAHQVYRAMGLFAALPAAEGWQLDQAVMRPFRQWLAQPLRSASFDFGAQPGFVAEGRRRFVRTLQQHALVGIRPEFVLVNRSLYGLFRLFERLGARVCCQTAWTSG